MNIRKLSEEAGRTRRALGYSLAGLRYGLKEPAFRLELLLAAALAPLAFWVGETPAERALLIACLWLVLVVELLNTAIERTVDRISTEQHELSKKAKDMGSAAVFLSLCGTGMVWLIIWVG